MSEAIELVGTSTSFQKSMEEKLGREISTIEKSALAVLVEDDEEYAAAAKYLQATKALQKSVKDYWEPLRVSAKHSYDLVLERKKAMTEPLESAERILKGKMAGYIEDKERKQREQEEAMKRLAAEERERKLQEAADAEAAGDYETAEMAMAEAEIMDDAAIFGGTIETPKAKGTSVGKAWEIVSIDSASVPVEFAGVELRPVDQKIVMGLIKASKGCISIPGIKYKEVTKISSRAK